MVLLTTVLHALGATASVVLPMEGWGLIAIFWLGLAQGVVFCMYVRGHAFTEGDGV